MFRAGLFSSKQVSLKNCFACIGLVLVFASCRTAPAPAPAPVPAGPEWIRGAQHERFSNQLYLTAVGHGTSRRAAEMNAMGQLVTIFGVGIQVDTVLRESYMEVMRGGNISVTHITGYDGEIAIEAGMDNLIGIEIGDIWETQRGSYALAVLNKARAIQIYSELIRTNQAIIENLTNMSAAERNSLDGLSRYQFAAVLADMNANYAAVLQVVGAPQYAQGLRRGDDLRRGIQEILTAIPVAINVRNDRAGRIQSAFAAAFADLGFRTGGTGSRYVLEVNVVVEPTDHPGDRVIFSRMELSANFIDTSTGAVLLPYSFNLREGHATRLESENRTFFSAERRIAEEYPSLLLDFLARLISIPSFF